MKKLIHAVAIAALAATGLQAQSRTTAQKIDVEYTAKIKDALQDISPTVLGILGLPQPKEMTGSPLF